MKRVIFFISVVVAICLSSCVEENISYDEGLELTFSCDTLIMDTLFAIIRRLLKHESIAMPDKSHLHHQLLKLNFSVKKTVLIIYLITALFSTASMIFQSTGTGQKALIMTL